MATDNSLDRELRAGALYLSQCLTPDSGAIPHIDNVDIYGESVSLNGIAGGDLITYVNFHDRYDLDGRIACAREQERHEVAEQLQLLKNKGGIMVADVAGHEFVDSLRALMLHQIFHASILYELDLHGELTNRLFEHINTRFFKSRTLRKLAGGLDAQSFVTLIYGEIDVSGRFRFISAGHPPPLIFSRAHDRFVEISSDRLISYPPIGIQIVRDAAEVKLFPSVLGYKEKYTTNELNLMGHGDVLLLFTDGLTDSFCPYTQGRLERAVSRAKDGTAEEICREIFADRNASFEPEDDISLVVIKYR